MSVTKWTGAHLHDGYRAPAANAALTLLQSDRLVELQSTNTSTVAATMSSLLNDTEIEFVLTVRTLTGGYTFAVTRGATAGTATLAAVGATLKLRRQAGVWRFVGGTATFA